MRPATRLASVKAIDLCVAYLVLVAAACLTSCASGNGNTQPAARSAPAPPRSAPPPPKSVYGPPAGQFAGRAPRGALLLIAGGGWRSVTPKAFAHEVLTALIFRRLGYLTLTVGYRGGAAGLADVEHAYGAVQHRYPHLPVCAIGTSAGGTLALLLAANRPHLSCVIALAGPTDLPALGAQADLLAYRLAVRAFGRSNLNRYSPVRYAHAIRARLLLIYATSDPVVHPSQGREMVKADPRARLIILPPGPTPFVHSRVSTFAAHQAEAAEVVFLANAMANTPYTR